MEYFSFLSCRLHRYFESSVEWDKSLFLKDCVWLPSLSLKVLLVSPIYCFWGDASDVTVALYTMFLIRQCPSSGQLGLVFGQLHLRSSDGSRDFRICLL